MVPSSRRYPSAFESIIKILQVVSFKITALLPQLPLRCLSSSLAAQLRVVCLVPLAVVALAIAIGAAPSLLSRPRSERLRSLTGALLLPSLPFVLVWTFILSTFVSSLGFRALACAQREPNPQSPAPARPAC